MDFFHISSEPDRRRLRAMLSSRLVRAFPALQKNERLRQDSLDRLMQVVQQAAPPSRLCFIADCSRLDTFATLDAPLLQAIISASAESTLQNQFRNQFPIDINANRLKIDCFHDRFSLIITFYLCNSDATWEQMVRNFMLCIKCNRADICATHLINSPPWTEITIKVIHINHICPFKHWNDHSSVEMPILVHCTTIITRSWLVDWLIDVFYYFVFA